MALHKTTIILADDHDMIRKGLQSILETRDDWKIVAHAADGRDALEAVKQFRPDIAIIDFFLPFMNGLELTRAIRQESPNTEVCVFTMLNDESIIRDVLAAGAKGYIFKTDPAEQIMAAVQALIRHKPCFSEAISEKLLARYLSSKDHDGGILTNREREVVQLIAEGMINKEISFSLGISVKTVETHRASVMHKLNFKTTAQLVRYAVRNHIVEA